ncbi:MULTISPECIES: outer envelope protein [unclassified Massilia]|uniref:outer envelope protein n=1 Tax=unclassified Massilia TaxID=2609279 RepID=UPI001B816180|nr:MULTISPECIES: outer envelope protein [unclassified Massilia]MBQ5940688.1 outer envelope protein [Massilia sp. AB1]MBQ5961685.1 outer envelope protein [Massilia sp. ZL223]
MTKTIRGACCAALMLAAGAANALDWSDNAVSWRYGTRFAEPFNPEHINKHVLALTHASGYKYGSNYFNLDLLKSDSKDPKSLTDSSGAEEAYLLYRHTLDIGALSGRELRFGPVKGLGLTGGFDLNHKEDVGYNSRKRMLVLGPTLMWDVPGFLNTSLLLIHESNAPSGAFPPISGVAGRRYTYDNHPMLSASWGIPVAEGWSFEGYANFIAAKGLDEVGNPTSAETNIDMQLMYDIGARYGQKKNRFRIGVEYQFWNNKFGNSRVTTGGRGQRASTPMVRAEYHF